MHVTSSKAYDILLSLLVPLNKKTTTANFAIVVFNNGVFRIYNLQKLGYLVLLRISRQQFPNQEYHYNRRH